MTKLAPEWVRTSDPVIRSPVRYHWTTAPSVRVPVKHFLACMLLGVVIQQVTLLVEGKDNDEASRQRRLLGCNEIIRHRFHANTKHSIES